MDAQIVAVLRAMEERLTAIMELLTDPEGRVQQAQNDTLRIYGDTAQMREVFGIVRDQLQAMADALAILVGRFIEHDRRVGAQHGIMLDMLKELASNVGAQQIAERAEAARAQLAAEDAERLAEIALSADEANALIKRASLAAQSLISRALNQAEHEIAAAAEEARETLHHDATEEEAS